MSKKYIYTLAPTDYFIGFITEKEVLENQDPNTQEIIKDKIKKAKELFEEYTPWEGDGEVYISSLPGEACDAFPEIFVTIKQSNNGSTFLCSPIELPYLEEFLEKQI